MIKGSRHEKWVELENRHQEKLKRKAERIGVLRALVDMHTKDPNVDHEYLVGLRARLRTAICNFESMKP
jgi:hypothetical protein